MAFIEFIILPPRALIIDKKKDFYIDVESTGQSKHIAHELFEWAIPICFRGTNCHFTAKNQEASNETSRRN
jgi:hypothetical protein